MRSCKSYRKNLHAEIRVTAPNTLKQFERRLDDNSHEFDVKMEVFLKRHRSQMQDQMKGLMEHSMEGVVSEMTDKTANMIGTSRADQYNIGPNDLQTICTNRNFVTQPVSLNSMYFRMYCLVIY